MVHHEYTLQKLISKDSLDCKVNSYETQGFHEQVEI